MHSTRPKRVSRGESGRRRHLRFLAICALLVAVPLVASCGDETQLEFRIKPAESTVAVGESLTLSVVEYSSRPGCSDQVSERQAESSEFVWAVDAEGATCENGVFVATQPGEYYVTADSQTRSQHTGATVTVVEQAAKLQYDNHNKMAVENNGTPPTFEIDLLATITSIETYHWNNGSGSPKTGEISLKAEDGTIYGPWETQGTAGQGGVPNAYWTASPTIEIPAGIYTVIDSDPSTWSQNSGSEGKGMVRIYTATGK